MAAKNPFSNPLSTPAKVIDLFHRYGLLDDDRVETIKQHAANNESGAQERVYQQTRLALKNYRRLKAIQKNRRKAIERSDAFGVWSAYQANKGEYETITAADRLNNAYTQADELLRTMDDALKIIKKIPREGITLYPILYYTYFTQKRRPVKDILPMVATVGKDGCISKGISESTYYRRLKDAEEYYSVALWNSPNPENGVWFDVLLALQDVLPSKS